MQSKISDNATVRTRLITTVCDSSCSLKIGITSSLAQFVINALLGPSLHSPVTTLAMLRKTSPRKCWISFECMFHHLETI